MESILNWLGLVVSVWVVLWATTSTAADKIADKIWDKFSGPLKTQEVQLSEINNNLAEIAEFAKIIKDLATQSVNMSDQVKTLVAQIDYKIESHSLDANSKVETAARSLDELARIANNNYFQLLKIAELLAQVVIALEGNKNND